MYVILFFFFFFLCVFFAFILFYVIHLFLFFFFYSLIFTCYSINRLSPPIPSWNRIFLVSTYSCIHTLYIHSWILSLFLVFIFRLSQDFLTSTFVIDPCLVRRLIFECILVIVIVSVSSVSSNPWRIGESGRSTKSANLFGDTPPTVCIYVRMYVCMYVCICMCVFSVYVSMYVCIHTYL